MKILLSRKDQIKLLTDSPELLFKIKNVNWDDDLIEQAKYMLVDIVNGLSDAVDDLPQSPESIQNIADELSHRSELISDYKFSCLGVQ